MHRQIYLGKCHYLRALSSWPCSKYTPVLQTITGKDAARAVAKKI